MKNGELDEEEDEDKVSRRGKLREEKVGRWKGMGRGGRKER